MNQRNSASGPVISDRKRFDHAGNWKLFNAIYLIVNTMKSTCMKSTTAFKALSFVKTETCKTSEM